MCTICLDFTKYKLTPAEKLAAAKELIVTGVITEEHLKEILEQDGRA